jgi:hypothetical protein
MDPNATLDSIRELVAKSVNKPLDEADSDTLAELVDALDSWLSRGGFLPTEWYLAALRQKRNP